MLQLDSFQTKQREQSYWLGSDEMLNEPKANCHKTKAKVMKLRAARQGGSVVYSHHLRNVCATEFKFNWRIIKWEYTQSERTATKGLNRAHLAEIETIVFYEKINEKKNNIFKLQLLSMLSPEFSMFPFDLCTEWTRALSPFVVVSYSIESINSSLGRNVALFSLIFVCKMSSTWEIMSSIFICEIHSSIKRKQERIGKIWNREIDVKIVRSQTSKRRENIHTQHEQPRNDYLQWNKNAFRAENFRKEKKTKRDGLTWMLTRRGATQATVYFSRQLISRVSCNY